MSGLHGILSTRSGESTRPRTALVVDSDFGNVHTIAQALRSDGFDVFEATSFQEGKFLWSTQTPDVLVVDIRLGQFNGLQLLMRARSDRPNITAIITSSFADSVLEAETRRFGGIFMIKPVDMGSVLEIVRGVAVSAAAMAASPVPMIDGRTSERRVLNDDFLPDRQPQANNKDRRAVDRRNAAIPGYFPERRKTERRTSRNQTDGRQNRH